MKEKIKERILKNIADVWGYNDSTFDPVVELLIEACATELERISWIHSQSNARILEKIAGLLLPQSMNNPTPAYSIFHAKPNEVVFSLPVGYQFQYINPENNANSFWCTISTHHLFQAHLKYIHTGCTLYRIIDYWQKKVYNSSFNHTIPFNSILLGIEVSQLLVSISGLSVYFDVRNTKTSEKFYQHLPHCKIYLNNKLLAFKCGLGIPPEPNNIYNDLAAHSCQDYDSRVFSILEKHFLTITDERTIEELTSDHDINLENVSEPILWLKIEFAPTCQNMADDLFCNINCFPVINKKPEQTIVRKIPIINLIPVELNDQLYTISSIEDNSGCNYKLTTGANPANLAENELLLYKSDTNKFDERNVYELLTWIIDIIRIEYLPFQLVKSEVLNAKLESLKQIILQLDDLIPGYLNKNNSYALVAKPGNLATHFRICFSSTKANNANNIKAGSKSLEYQQLNLIRSSIVFIQPSQNGRNKPNDNEMIDILRYQLLTHQRIVTMADIESLCSYKFGSALSSASVKKGTTILPGKDGYSASLNIDIRLKPEHHLSDEQIYFIKDEILYHLKTQSSNLFPFIINIILEKQV